MFKNCKYCKYCKEQETIYGDIFYICSIDNRQTRLVDYSGKDITHSKHVMHWQPNGKFIETFDKGFMTANDELVKKLYDLIDK